MNVLGLAIILVMTPITLAQQVVPRIGFAYPAGGRQGTTFQVAIGGQFLEGSAEVHFSGTGVRAKVLEHTRPLTVAQAGLLRDRLKELMEKRVEAMQPGNQRPSTRPAWTDADIKEITEIRKKLSTFIPRNQVNPALVETVTIEVTIAADAEPGERDIRLRGPLGLTNPLVFCVGQVPEFSRKLAVVYREPKNGLGPNIPPPEPDLNITLPATVNGQIMPGAVNRFHFKASKGQRLVAAVSARALIPYLPDAVPGWFQATLTLYDAKGNELAYADDYRFNPDPVLFYEIPNDGEYVAEIRDSIYRGREDFVYRITLGELPFVTSIFPLGGRAGAQTPVDLKGWNLPVSRLAQDARDKGRGIMQISVRKGDCISNRVPFSVDVLPECNELEPNDLPATAQPVTLPVIVNGRINKPGDIDVFRFEGRAGDDIVAETYARRLNSPLDSTLTLTDAAGRQLAFNDDHEDKGSGLNTHHADSWLRATLPASGTYYIHVAEAQNSGGEEYAYRLRISPPRPDFELRVTPSSINARGGTNVPLTVYALRKDGFSGEISLSLKDAPAGTSLAGAKIPANQDLVRLTLAAPATPLETTLQLEGRAMVQGHEVVRQAVPAENMMQAFAYR
ncbi:MAG: PPC domain-containing protein, partial [Tepidisphaeraceae bacterium]